MFRQGFLHHGTTMALYDAGELPQGLLTSMCALAVKLDTPESPEPARWMDEVIRDLPKLLLYPEWHSVAVFLHLAFYQVCGKNVASTWQIAGMACR